jgi:single-stranded DNA-binding protein
VVGRLRFSEWTGRDGEKRSRLQVVAEAVHFLGAPTKTSADTADGDEPADKPAVGSYRRKAS